MCDVAERLEKMGMEKGIEKGIEEGKIKKLIEIIKKNTKRGIKGEDLADFLGEDLVLTREIQKIVLNNPDADTEEVYVAVQSMITKL